MILTESFRYFQMASASDTKWQKDAADQNFDYMFKLLIIGNSSVGKTSFLFRYADDSFTSAFVSTVGIDFKVKTVFRQDKRVKLQIWVSCVFNIEMPTNPLLEVSISYHLDYKCNFELTPTLWWVVLGRTGSTML